MMIRKPLRRWHLLVAVILLHAAVGHWTHGMRVQWQMHAQVVRNRVTNEIMGVRQVDVKADKSPLGVALMQVAIIAYWASFILAWAVIFGIWFVPAEGEKRKSKPAGDDATA